MDVNFERPIARRRNTFTNGAGIYLLPAQFGKNQKNTEEITRCFLVANYHYLNKTKIREKENKEKKYLKYLKRMSIIISNNAQIILENNKSREIIETSRNIINDIIIEFKKDSCLFKIISSLNNYSHEEVMLIKKILKSLIKLCLANKMDILNIYMNNNLMKIINHLQNNLVTENIVNEAPIFVVTKVIRLIFKNKEFFKTLLLNKIIIQLHLISISNKFILASEAFKTIFSILENPKIDKNLFAEYLKNSKEEICDHFYDTLVSLNDDESSYFVKRETLSFFNLVFQMNEFEDFKEYFTNNSKCLKMILIQFNDECLRVKFQSIQVVSNFFYDLESKNEVVRKILKKNKNNFDIFFTSLNEHLEKEENAEIKGVKNFIYYEYEKLVNASI